MLKDKIADIVRKATTYFLLLSLTLFIVNKAVYFHEHKQSNGTIKSHAHPFDKAADSEPYKTHHHSTAELYFFSHLDTLIFVAIIAFAFHGLLKEIVLTLFLRPAYDEVSFLFIKSRAPPIV